MLFDVDLSVLGRVLNPDAEKIRAKGVKSVRSRVMNLKEACPQLTAEMLRDRLTEAFEEEYGLPAERTAPDRTASDEIRKEADFLASEAWLFPPRIPFTAEWSGRFPWGRIRILVHVKQNRIDTAACESDAMDESLILRIRDSLAGCRYDPEAAAERILRAASGNPTIASDIAGMILKRT